MFARISGVAVLAAILAQPLAAEVAETGENHFVTRHESVVEADTKRVWLELISPARWWNSAHTFSADSANLTLVPQAGGCFCEKIPEDPDLEKITLEGSVEHMRVIHAFPEKSLLMRGGLGPLQTEPAAGVLTIAISEADEGTRIVWSYNVGGPMRYEIDVISKAVDGVLNQQLAGLAERLGPIDGVGAAANEEEEGEDNSGSDPQIEVEEDVIDEGAEADSQEEADGPSVEEAFEDLIDEQRL
ncbi:MAG: SRPBCC family protein [Pseudomonadota bacterium]